MHRFDRFLAGGRSDPKTTPPELSLSAPIRCRCTELHAVEALRASLNVMRAAQRGYVLIIAVTSPEPVEAARLANAVAETYLVDKLDARLEAANGPRSGSATGWSGCERSFANPRKPSRNSAPSTALYRAAARRSANSNCLSSI